MVLSVYGVFSTSILAADDHGNNSTTATSVAVGSLTSGTLELEGDQDYFKFEVTTPGVYVIFTRGRIRTYGSLFDPNSGTTGQWFNDYGSGEDGNFYIGRSLKAGTHYVAVSGESRSVTGAYELHVEGPGAGTVSDDHGFSVWSATAVPSGTITQGELQLAGDQDYFTFTVITPGTYVIYTRGRTDTTGWLFDPNSGTSGTWLTDYSSGEEQNFRFERTLKPGIHYVAVTGGNSSTTGAYEFHLEGPPTLSPAPQISMHPQSQTVPVGTSATLSLSASGASPITFEWYFNGKVLSEATGSRIVFPNTTLENGGDYFVIVRSPYGFASSRTARLGVYLAPSVPQPGLPDATPTTEAAPPKLTTAPRKPSSEQLIVFNPGGLIDPQKMTIVLTHGWKSSAEGDAWPVKMAAKLLAERSDDPRAGYGPTANILAWNWKSEAAKSLAYARSQTISQGEGLGAELLWVLRGGYNKPIHFIGHSLGTLVNCRAADYIHGDTVNSANLPSKLLPQNTHVTLLDQAELSDARLLIDLRYYGDLVIGGPGEVIPKRSRWVDNYISEVGVPHRQAAN